MAATRFAAGALFDDGADAVGSKVLGIYGLLFLIHAAAWAWALLLLHRFPSLIGTAILAYSFGLRHAVDADHLAAIDGVTRKLMQEGKRPVSAGLLFSLGHSTVVMLGSVAVAFSALFFAHRAAALRQIGGTTGTLVSAFFLIAIGFVNLAVLRSVYRTYQRVRAGEPYIEEDLNLLLSKSGFLSRLFRPMFQMIRSSWQMYPLGLLFGLGFDTATEIGVLAISATEASKGLPLWSILIFPALFTAGMSLIDATDNILMLGAYGWAFVSPVRKLYYNMTVTSMSVAVALGVGGVEILGLLVDRFRQKGALWSLIAGLNGNLGTLGYAILALFGGSWFVAVLLFRWRRFDNADEISS